ncbi:calcium/sodium antiporter [Halodurantibacterium flavum]|uniref:Calcium/sodium antiporter n=1 Tax=Halodurantibacterium flavum TaxID=1382802 RepID=A0ABW4S7D8_9RHOB
MLYDLLFVAAGLVLLVMAGDALVKGAVNLALRLGFTPLVVGLTVVAFGTSAPELLVSVKAVLTGAPGIAIGNVVGSNTANILLVLGVPALIATIHTAGSDTRRSYLSMLAASVLFIVLCLLGPVTWWHGLILLAGLTLMLIDAYRNGREEEAEGELEGVDPGMGRGRIAIYLVAGLIGLPLGADLLVRGASSIARDMGVSETVIGLTLVAVGTSLPELATTLIAALRREADVALGNIIGSNMFNLLGIIGVAGLVGTIPIDPEILRFDLWIMLAASVLLAPFVFRGWTVSRPWGAGLTALYAGYVAILLI